MAEGKKSLVSVPNFGLVKKLVLDPRVPKLKKLVPIAAILYLLYPADLLPGLPFDDWPIVMFAFNWFVRSTPLPIRRWHQHQQFADELRERGLERRYRGYEILDDGKQLYIQQGANGWVRRAEIRQDGSLWIESPSGEYYRLDQREG